MTDVRKAVPYKGLAASLVAGRYLDLGSAITTPPTTGLKEGYTFLAWSGTLPMLGVCFSSANGIKYIPFGTQTFGRATA
jgi:hypothetical protein